MSDKDNLEQLDKINPTFERFKTENQNQKSNKKDKAEIEETTNKDKISKIKESNGTYLYILEILTPNHGDKVQIQCKVTGSLALEIT
ncbi:unnamed protein product [Rotaria sordida]|uniref:Uncharacterized protein n=1 Tax=Rotaria sordida TaxID=392033 RepID=A0A818YU86_9BILA|nr:unnamed protein product [Rotaria sordida]CAF3757575.1 unnamed protein product [Rotaria sordida]